jgi:capsular polysaccharide biosynthesis protein
MPKGKKVVDIQEVINLLNQSQKSTASFEAIAKQVSIIEKAVQELNRLMNSDEANEQVESPAKEKTPYTGKPRGRKPKVTEESA